MTILKKPFRPACNRLGYAKLTYKACELMTGIKADGKAYEFIKLNFICMGMDRSINQAISINMSPAIDLLDENSHATKVLCAMGMELPKAEETETEIEYDLDGFPMDKIEVGEDGFSVDDDDSNPHAILIEEFLDSCKRKEFLAFVAKNAKGFWDVDVDSLKPLN